MHGTRRRSMIDVWDGLILVSRSSFVLFGISLQFTQADFGEGASTLACH